MNHRSKEVIANISLAAALATGATACGGSTHVESKPRTFHIETTNPYGVRIEQAAKRLIQVAGITSTRYEGKPPYSIGFTIATREGGSIDFSVQTATPQHDPSQVELIEVEQIGPNEANFDLSLYANNDGTWDMYCDTNPYSNNVRTLNEYGQNTIQLNNKTIDTQSAHANALLGDEINNLDTLIGTAAAEESTPAIGDICAINLH